MSGATALRSIGPQPPDDAQRSRWWRDASRTIVGQPRGGLNIAQEAVDRHAAGPDAGMVAFRWIARDGTTTESTYADLAERTNRFANVLRALDVDKGDRVFTLLGRVPELYIAALGALKNVSVVSPLFSVFGPDPIHQRLLRGDGRVLVTTAALYHRKVAPIRDALPGLEHVLIVGGGAGEDCSIDFDSMMAQASPVSSVPPTDPEDMALLHFTSGTTGTPKGAVHVHGAVVAHHATAAVAFGLRPGEVYWCTADPGWVTGMSYGIIAPLTHRVTSIVDDADFDAERWYRTLEEHRVQVWYTAPTALRMLMRGGTEIARAHDLTRLRLVASVGEALSADTVEWGRVALGTPVHDTWWQTETGAILIANPAGEEVRPGSMGRPLPGVEVAILRLDQAEGRAAVVDGHVAAVTQPGVPGELALRPGWPSMFRGYLHDDERYAACFTDGWYLTGDVAHRDEDGFLWFEGRTGDVIKSAGHLIGPVEVERVLLRHDAVAEAAVIGVPDPTAGEVVQAHVVLVSSCEHGEDVRSDILGFARRHLGPAVAPRTIVFEDSLPKTRSGKIMRRLVRARFLGLPEGDLSTLELQP